MSLLSKKLKEKFPWLGTDDENITGSDTIQELSDLYEYEEMDDKLFITDIIIDWDLLAKQKIQIMRLRRRAGSNGKEAIEGIVNLIEAIQDYAVASEQVEENTVFPTTYVKKDAPEEQPSIIFEGVKYWEIGCSKCNDESGEWRTYTDGNGNFSMECQHCGHTTKFPPKALKEKPDQN